MTRIAPSRLRENMKLRLPTMRFRLLTFLCLCLVIATILGSSILEYNRHVNSIDWIESNDGAIIYSKKNEWSPGLFIAAFLLGKDSQKLNRIETIELTNSNIESIQPLDGLRDLNSITHANFSENHLLHDVRLLGRMKRLKTVSLVNTSVSDVSFVRRLNDLESLAMDGTPVENINELRFATKLQELFLDGTNVRDLSPLRNLSSLRDLFLMDSHADEAEVSKLKKAIPRCEVY